MRGIFFSLTTEQKDFCCVEYCWMMGCQWGTKVIGRHVLLSYINYDIYFSHINNPYYGRRIIDAPPSQSIYLIFGQKDLFLSDIGYFFRQTDKMLKIIKSKKSNSFYKRYVHIEAFCQHWDICRRSDQAGYYSSICDHLLHIPHLSGGHFLLSFNSVLKQILFEKKDLKFMWLRYKNFLVTPKEGFKKNFKKLWKIPL